MNMSPTIFECRACASAACWALGFVGARHAADGRVDGSALALDFVHVEASPRDAVVADSHDQDAAFIEESISDPNAEVASGFAQNIMPQDYGSQLSQQELADLVAFLQPAS